MRPSGSLLNNKSPRTFHLSRICLQLVDMIVSDLRGSLAPKFYDTALSVGTHACAAASSMDWKHVALSMYASAGLYNLRWFKRGIDRIGVSSSDPAAVFISLPAPSTPHPTLQLPLLLLHLSHSPNFTACAAPLFKIYTTATARVCIGEREVQLEERQEGSQFCTRSSGEGEVRLRCSASPTAGGALHFVVASHNRHRHDDDDDDDEDHYRQLNQYYHRRPHYHHDFFTQYPL